MLLLSTFMYHKLSQSMGGFEDDEILIRIPFREGKSGKSFFWVVARFKEELEKEMVEDFPHIYPNKSEVWAKENYNNAKGSIIVHVVFVKMILMAQTVGKFLSSPLRVQGDLKRSEWLLGGKTPWSFWKLSPWRTFEIFIFLLRLRSRKSPSSIWNNSIYWWINIIGWNWKSNKT
jgi:hypothetical protein